MIKIFFVFVFRRVNLCSALLHMLPSRLAQLVERKTLNLVVVGSSPTVGDMILVGWPSGLRRWF